ncbi:MAG: DUF3179 domain-containing protein [Halioglobus sp.]
MRLVRAMPYVLPLVLMACLSSTQNSRAQGDGDPGQVVGEFLLLLLGSQEGKQQAIEFVATQWQPEFVPMMLEVITFNQDPAFGAQLVALLENKTGRSFGFNSSQWQQWLWSQEPLVYPLYADFKGALYGLIDAKFENYFAAGRTATIRLDEVIWGGVHQDGIPPLRYPQMISANDADYLADDNIVFALEVNGDARAYPRRILGWHEMFVDTVGGVPVAGVYCTLCGTMILYNTMADGVNHELGTSGFLYRSNKLMYDKATQSLWSTIWGKPVIGPLAQKDLTLERLSVVTTTWGEWRRRHPDTRVLSLRTGHSRDYAEGAAYRDYYATDELMFPVPALDSRLKNKDEILGLRFPQYPEQPLAIAAKFLLANPLYHDKVDALGFVVVTDGSGANRVYQSLDVTFTDWDGQQTLRDDQGVTWQLDESRLQATDGRVLYRLPAHRAFWFGWFSAFNHTRLVH